MNVANLPSEHKLEYLKECVLSVRSGGEKAILCPYCGEINFDTNEFLCCELFSEAMNAVLRRLEQEDCLDFLSNVADKARVN